MATKMEKMEVHATTRSLLRLFVEALAVVGILLFALSLWQRHRGPEAPAIASPAPELREFTSVDGKVRCYASRSGISCLPVWLISRPENWLLYAKPREKAK